MKRNRKNRVTFTDQMVLWGFGIAVVYWLLDSFMSIFLSQEGALLERIFGPDFSDIWTRLIVLCLFIIFGSHAQFTMNERRQAAEKMERDRATRERFQRLLSPGLAEMVVSGQLTVEKGGANRFATVLFVDIRGFTAMSENTEAAELLQLLNEYYEMVVEVVFRFEGTVDKFMGDAIMVIWGAPVAHADDPVRAVRAALNIKESLVGFNRKREADGKELIRIGMGLNTGQLVAGYIGSSQTMSYSVIGDTVNTAARLCSAAEAGQIIISDDTHQHVNGVVETQVLAPLQAKGKFNPIRVYNVTKPQKSIP